MSVPSDQEAESDSRIVLQSSEELFRTMAEILDEGLMLIEGNEATFINDRLVEIIGYPREELVNQRLSDLNVPETGDGLEDIERTIDADTGARTRTEEVWISRKDGERVCIRYQCRRLSDNSAGVHRWAVIVSDVTQQRQAEQHLQDAAKMEAIGRLAGGLAHEYNNILTGIMGFADILKLQIPRGTTESQMVEYIISASTRAADLTQKLLGFARKGKHRDEYVDIGKAITNAAQILRATQQNVRIQTVLPETPLGILGDPGQFDQVLMNLGINALEAMPDGGDLTFRAEEVAEASSINGSAKPLPGPVVRITVEDTGCGIPPERIARVFEPFYSTKPLSEGAGLGLSMVYGAVAEHGGDVRIESDIDRGTRVRIQLPRMETPAPIAKRGETPNVAAVPSSQRVLVIDDEAIVRDSATAMLAVLGYRVVTANDGAEGLARYREEHEEIDAILLDMVMPVMDGRTCLQHLLEFDPGAKVIVTTGYSDQESHDLTDLGAVGFCHKPFSLAEFRSQLDHAFPSA